MHHQTLLFPSSSSSPPPYFQLSSSSSFALPLCPLPALAYSHCPQVEKETRMEALKSSLRPAALSSEKQGLGILAEEPVWVDERGSLLGDLSVDDLLDFGEFGDNDKEVDNQEPAVEMEAEATAAAGRAGAVAGTEIMEMKSKPEAHDAREFEWVSFIVDDSCSDFLSCGSAPLTSLPPADTPQVEKRQTTAVLFTGSAAVQRGTAASFFGPTVCTLSTEAPVPVKAKRSKRSRTVTVGWAISGQLPFADSSSSTTTTSPASSCSSTSSPLSSCLLYEDHNPSTGSGQQSFLLYESHPTLPPHPSSKKQHKPKKRGRKPKAQQSSGSASSSATAASERRCSHCGVQKTPQWRAGPLGAKTLCNACGVRFKSGRLLPEYRPACSPTFVSSIHSNSHRKVLEMRRKKEAELHAAAHPMPAVTSF